MPLCAAPKTHTRAEKLDYCKRRAYMGAMTNATATFPTRFLKMHGLGNDFVVVDGRARALRIDPAHAQRIADRHRGVGFDQLVLIENDDGVDAKVTFFNGDGSVAGACGNATRCVAHLLMQESGADHATIRTVFGDLPVMRVGVRDGALYAVNMGVPRLNWDEVPLAQDLDTKRLPIDGGPGAVSMGNPHMVFAVDDADTVDVRGRGATLEHHPLFPERANVEFCEVLSPKHIRMRVWERGTGITLACGSGACAAVVALHRQGLVERKVDVDLDGGRLNIDWREDGVWMIGPVAFVFEGQFDPAFFE